MATNTTFDPRNSNDFDKTKMIFNSQGVSASCSLNTTTNIDLTFTDDHLITGFWLVGINLTFGDKIDLQVVDVNNIYGYGAGTVLKQFATNIYLPEGAFNEQFDVAYPAKIYTGLALRVVYHSTAIIGTTPSFAINYKLHKILI